MLSFKWYEKEKRNELFCIITTGICGFVECLALCRVLFVGHSTKKPLPSAALGKVFLSVTNAFAESRTLGKELHSAKISLSSAKHLAKAALGKGSSAAIYN
jgi:hypothetical protein